MLTRALPRYPKSVSDALQLAFVWAAVATLCLWSVSVAAAQVVLPPLPQHWVNDSTQFLSQAARTTLDERLATYERQSGHQVVVYIGPNASSLPLNEFANKTFETWRLGRAKLDDGVLVVVVPSSRQIAVEVGYGLEDRIPDAIAARIIDDVMVPKLREGDPDGALTSGLNAVLDAIGDRSGSGPPVPSDLHPSEVGEMILFGLAGIVFLLLLATHPSLALSLLFVLGRGGGGGDSGFSGGFGGGRGGRSGGGGARGSW